MLAKYFQEAQILGVSDLVMGTFLGRRVKGVLQRTCSEKIILIFA